MRRLRLDLVINNSHAIFQIAVDEKKVVDVFWCCDYFMKNGYATLNFYVIINILRHSFFGTLGSLKLLDSILSFNVNDE